MGEISRKNPRDGKHTSESWYLVDIFSLFNLPTQNVKLSFLNDFFRPPLDLTHVN